MDKREHRCDQCVASHVKCDRLLPQCSRCKKRYTKCTFNREVIYHKKGGYKHGSKKYSPDSEPKVIPKISFVYIKEVDIKHPQTKKCKHQLLKVPKDYDFSYNVVGIFNKFQRKLLLENLLNFIQNPSPFFPSKGLNLFIALTDKLGLLTFKPKKLTFTPKVPKEDKFNIGPIIKQAIISYFEFSNKIFPLFDETRFNFLSCSFNLKSAILMSGLICMEQTKIVKDLIQYFEGKLYEFASKVPRIKPSLESIQTILIIISGIAYIPWVGCLKEFLLFHCYRMSFTIGLNQPSRHLSKEVNAGRVYTYCLLNSYYTGTLLSFGSYVAEPMLPLELKKLDEHFKSKFCQYPFDFSKDDRDVQQYCFLKLHEFYYIISTIFFDLRLIKEKKIIENKDQVKFCAILQKLAFKIVATKEKYIRIMNDILINSENQKLISTIKDYQNCITYYFHHTNYYIYSIQFTLSMEKKVYEFREGTAGKNSDINALKCIKIVLNKCYSVIDSATINSHKYSLTLNCALVSTCLVFMLRYGEGQEETMAYIQKGKEFLRPLFRVPSIIKMCDYNLKLIEIIEDSLKDNIDA
ncbi:hypothetical protein K502DRAFT_368213 [Neoconidiobolus thromboides FSU 785]|nr:hypothetical protein K502DRAFT_368213 [Neoconidiobolus thromboides FSU 785]